ncbi:uracil phosphoribosyltransferase [Eisenibacter elegans]|jgi:uracil phosphoribosyltransferase|uniref:uracil phosphoribosyltransferase n=1 Tax=Eisenibacter elegans TaxID=997 RepID=UPI0003FFF46A|nr:uracil phosphoribosyltransferase [Eisenibacter elegans]
MFVLTQTPSVANQWLAALRDHRSQQHRGQFRHNLSRIGEALAYEISRTLAYQTTTITTVLGQKQTQTLVQHPVLVSIMRAGLPMHEGMLRIFDEADSAFVGAYRGRAQADHSFEIEQHYLTTPNLEGRVVILADPMLATGRSLLSTMEVLRQYGQPAQWHVAAIIASRQGVALIQQEMPEAKLWLGDIDETLNDKAYIVPGLGDAGDLAFGSKLD